MPLIRFVLVYGQGFEQKRYQTLLLDPEKQLCIFHHYQDAQLLMMLVWSLRSPSSYPFSNRIVFK